MAFLGSLDIVGSALTAERFRMNIILQNIANEKTTVTENDEPYRRKQVVSRGALSFRDELKKAKGGVQIAAVVESDRDFKLVYDPLTRRRTKTDTCAIQTSIPPRKESI